MTSRAGRPVRVDARPLRRAFVVLLWILAVAFAIELVLLGLVYAGVLGSLAVVIPPLFIAILSYAGVGLLLAIRRPDNPIGLVLVIGGLLIATTFSGYMTGSVATVTLGPTNGLAVAGSLLGTLSLCAAVMVVAPVLAVLFPTGTWLSGRWRRALLVVLAGIAAGDVLALLRPGPLSPGLAINPFGVDAPGVRIASSLGSLLAALSIPASCLLTVGAVVTRYRRARGVERQQLRWYVTASMLLAVLLVASVADGATGFTAFDLLAVSAFAFPPVAVGVAVMRYRLYDLDRLISRTLAWALVTAILALVFAGAVIALQALLAGVTQGATLAVAGSTLVAFALFQPVRRRVQRAVDRRFDRSRVDAERAVASLSDDLRESVSLAAVTDAVVRATDGLRPANATLWIRGGGAR